MEYRLKQIDTDGTFIYYNTTASVNAITGINELSLPEEFSLSQNYPNPFNPATIILYSIPAAALSEVNVSLIVYDILGNHVATLVNEQQAPGFYSVQFNGNNLATGLYIYRLTAGDPSASSGHGFIKTSKMILIK